MTDRLDENVKLLRDWASPTTLDEVLHPLDEEPTLHVETSEGRSVFKAEDGNGRLLSIHSPRRPREEAEGQVAGWLKSQTVGQGSLIVCLGIGAGYHLCPLLDSLKEGGALVVIDPHPRAVHAVLRHINLAELQRDDIEIRFIISRDKERIYREFFSCIDNRPRIDYAFYTHPGILRAFASAYQPLAKRLANRVRLDLVQRQTLFKLSRSWLENSLENVPLLVNSTPFTALATAFTDTPAAVIAAGPSLERSLPLLSRLQDRMLMVAVGTAFRPLVQAGIRPHLVVLVDGSPLIDQQFEGVRSDRTYLLTPPQIHPPVLKRFTDRLLSFATYALPEVDWWLNRFGDSTAILKAGGTVTASAIDAAVYMGCPEILVFGLDLACEDDGTSHVTHSMHEGNKYPVDMLISVPGNYCPSVLTTRQFALYIEILGGYVASLKESGGPTLLNITATGAQIPNLAHLHPDRVDVEARPICDGLWDRLEEACRNRQRAHRSKARAEVRTTCRRLSETRQDAEEASRLCKHLAGASCPEDSVHDTELLRLQRLEKKLTRKSGAGFLLSAAMRAQAMETVAYCAGIGSNDKEQFNHVHKKCGEFYQNMATTATWLNRSLQTLQTDLNQRPHAKIEIEYAETTT